jgi:large subunit ribosomal protein L6
MSRVGKLPVAIPSGVTVTVNGYDVSVKGAKSELKTRLNEEVRVEVKDGNVWVHPRDKADQRSRAMWGMSRNIIRNMVEGVSKGYTRRLEINGVGYRAAAEKNMLTLALGYSHEIKYSVPAGVEIKCEKPTLVVISGADKQLVGQVASEIRSLRGPEPYKGKGVRYEGEYVRQKEGKKK